MRTTKEEIQEVVVTIHSRMLEGLSDQEIADEMGFSLDDFLKFKQTMFEIKSKEVKEKPNEHVYVEYMLEQTKNIKALTTVIDDATGTKNYSAIVNAVRTRADILDRVLNKGQEFGFIHREPDRKEIIAGKAITELSKDKLKSLILAELNSVNAMFKKFGDKNIIEVNEAKELHYDLKKDKKKMLSPAKIDKKNKAATSKVHKGRIKTPNRPEPEQEQE